MRRDIFSAGIERVQNRSNEFPPRESEHAMEKKKKKKKERKGVERGDAFC